MPWPGAPERAPVGLRAGVQRLRKVVPQQDRMPEAGFPRDLVDIELRGLQQLLGAQHPLGIEPGRRGGPRFRAEAPRKRPRRHMDPGRQFVDRVFLVQVPDHPLQQLLHGLRAALRNGPVDVLGLAAVPVRRDHHVPGDGGGHLGAELNADQVQAGIDPRGRAGTGDDPAVFDVEDVFIHQDGGVSAGQFLGVVPVRGAAAAIEQARPGQGEGPGTDGHHPGTAGMGGPQRLQDGFGNVLVPAVRRHHHQVRVRSRFQPETDVHGQAGLERDVARLRGADAEIEGGHAVSAVRAVDAEDLESRRELEDREVGDHDHCH